MGFLDFLPIVGKVIDRVLPDKAAADAAKLRLVELTQQGQLAELDADTKLALAGADNVKTEAESQGWLTRSWRPITMLTFVVLIVARMFGLTSTAITAEEYAHLWDLVQFGLGGYVVGRSVEQTVKTVAPLVAGVLKK